MTVLPLALGGAGCAQNAILELTVQIRSDGNGLYAFTQVRPATRFPFEAEWRSSDDPDGVALASTEVEDRLSVEVEEPPGQVNVRIRFCSDPRCASADDVMAPEHRTTLESAFYLGEYTYYTLVVPRIPDGESEIQRVGKCEIIGCTAGDPTSDYCRADGRHFCE